MNENHQHEYFGKLAHSDCADLKTGFEESSQMGQCLTLGYRCNQIDLSVLF